MIRHTPGPDADRQPECPECAEHIDRAGDHHPQCPHAGLDAFEINELLDEQASHHLAERRRYP